jgi:hypothetical protein
VSTNSTRIGLVVVRPFPLSETARRTESSSDRPGVPNPQTGIGHSTRRASAPTVVFAAREDEQGEQVDARRCLDIAVSWPGTTCRIRIEGQA